MRNLELENFDIAYFRAPKFNLKITANENEILQIKLSKFWAKNDAKIMKNNENLAILIDEFDKYFRAKLENFSVKFRLFGTDFEQKIYKELLKIPYAKTATYSQIAQNIGINGAARAVGNANAKNTLLILIPCHRVVAAGGLGGYCGGKFGVKIKKFLLDLEQNFSQT